ncbi:peptidase family C78-domain-containing protein [Radiomyces spectabilis]|uniref:peptidase family C78-domain-containing protein n=1 Tax=Radiomyces spectabilis TaxID=64574 RepID=UPI00222105E1|nr:peptidase family C78-domain-containing protein [Radiomyces spectabilis]KAI8388851.1 peptidase family C78-domain-containing protein [Radiomyces spectabilis]
MVHQSITDDQSSQRITETSTDTLNFVPEEIWESLNALKPSSRTAFVSAAVIPQLIPQFRELYIQGVTTCAYLCSLSVDHVATGLLDLGWGCGYRNCQMLLTYVEAYQKPYSRIIRHIPDIEGLQILLEKAWADQFDPQGAEQLKHRVHRTRKWIGTTEVYTILTYLGIRCSIVDFATPSGPNNAHDALFDWVQRYFEGADTDIVPADTEKTEQHTTITDRPPIYLQHSGHSRTIIGIEVLPDGKRNLLIFDPGKRVPQANHTEKSSADAKVPDKVDSMSDPAAKPSSTVSGGNGWWFFSGWMNWQPLFGNNLRNIRVDSKTISRNKQYQLLVLGDISSSSNTLPWTDARGYILDAQEREQRKKITSVIGSR